jgi:hypothetical protein
MPEMAFGYVATTPHTERAADALQSTGDYRLQTEEAATGLRDDFTVAQAQATPEVFDTEANTASSLLTTTLPPDTTLDGVIVEERKQVSDQNALGNVLLALGVLLLIIAVATTFARRRQ